MQRCMPVVILHPVNLVMGVHQHKWCANFMPKTFLSNQTGAGVNLTCKLQFVDLIVKQLSFKFLCLCLSRGTLYQPVGGGQRPSCRSRLSPSTMWVSEIKLRSPALVASHSAGPLNNDFSWIFLKSSKYKDTIVPGPEVIRFLRAVIWIELSSFSGRHNPWFSTASTYLFPNTKGDRGSTWSSCPYAPILLT